MTGASVLPPPRIADVQGGLRHVFVRDMVLTGSIGVHPHERETRQRIRLNLDLAVREGTEPMDDELASVVCYEDIVRKVRGVVGAGHINLVETLAERVAEVCLRDPRVCSVRVRAEKLDVFPDVGSVGVEIERSHVERSH
ncbi:MAG: dihydroneopterin aldolase [Alphaproteobacteria bacterium]